MAVDALIYAYLMMFQVLLRLLFCRLLLMSERGAVLLRYFVMRCYGRTMAGMMALEHGYDGSKGIGIAASLLAVVE